MKGGKNYVGTFISLHDVGRLETDITDAGQADIIPRARAVIFACSDEKFKNNYYQ